jgi:hypothetical protein
MMMTRTVVFCCNKKDSRAQRHDVIKAIADHSTVAADFIDFNEKTPADLAELIAASGKLQSASFIFFVHESDFLYSSLTTIPGFCPIPSNVLVFFFCGVGLSLESNDPRVKFLRCKFDAEVKKGNCYYQRLVEAAGKATDEDICEFIKVNIDAPCSPPYEFIALDILVQGALSLVDQGKSIPSTWFSKLELTGVGGTGHSSYQDFAKAYLNGVGSARASAVRQYLTDGPAQYSAFTLFNSAYLNCIALEEIIDSSPAPSLKAYLIAIHENLTKVIECLCE